MQRVWVVVLAFLVLCGSAFAQVPKGNVFFGYSYEHTPVVSNDSINTNGWNASLEGKVFPFLGLVVDVDGHYGSGTFLAGCTPPVCSFTSADVAEHNVLLGPRVSFQVGKVRPFAEVMIGAAHISRSNGISDSDTSFANAVGGGLDYRVAGPISLRAQFDWIETRFYSNTQNGVRFSTGIAFHF
ncbi:MAG TPA: outer membrane beta-barrel protein [Terriglobales bacterium]|nr:outer membrane beta-barrel protein [Terriglobales bacterium]